jgi:DNA-binding beta-propeller fold protein YncE
MTPRTRSGLSAASVAIWFALAVLVPAGAGASGVYVTNSTSASVSVFGIGAGGALSPIACDFTTNCHTGAGPVGVAVDPSASHLYVTNSNAASVSVFSIDAGGGLSPVACDPTTICKTGSAPFGIAVDPSGSHVFVTNLGSASVSVFAISAGGALSPVACDPATICKTGALPEGVAVDPSGSHLYVANRNSASVSVFAIAASGVLSPVTCDPATSCQAGTTPVAIAIDPSGSHVYVTNQGTNSVSVFAVGAGGALSPVACDPATICKTGSLPQGVAVDPSGSHLYAVNGGAPASVSVFAIGAGGVLSPVACDPATICKAGSGPKAVAIDPSGSHLYVSTFSSGSVSMFSIAAGGVLSPIACIPATSCQTGSNSDLFSVAVSPDRGPTAAITASVGTAGSVSLLDGSTSISPDYPIASYVWDFGDGQTQTSALPGVEHTYANPGSYTLALGVSDQAGCSTALVFTGQTASCNGSAKAHVTQTITVPASVPPLAVVTKERISPSTFPAATSGASAQAAGLAAKKRKRTYGAKVTYTLNLAARVRFTVKRRSGGRKVKHAKRTTCDRPTKKNAKRKKCTRDVTVKGSFTRTGRAGTNTFRFTGRLNGKRLPAGRYWLVATPTANGRAGTAARASFRITR